MDPTSLQRDELCVFLCASLTTTQNHVKQRNCFTPLQFIVSRFKGRKSSVQQASSNCIIFNTRVREIINTAVQLAEVEPRWGDVVFWQLFNHHYTVNMGEGPVVIVTSTSSIAPLIDSEIGRYKHEFQTVLSSTFFSCPPTPPAPFFQHTNEKPFG